MASYTSIDRYYKVSGGRFALRKNEQEVTFAVVMAKENDSFERLANRYLRNPLRYWEIADINPHVEWPDRIPVGTSIRIPV